jgi:hypothetical protein
LAAGGGAGQIAHFVYRNDRAFIKSFEHAMAVAGGIAEIFGDQIAMRLAQFPAKVTSVTLPFIWGRVAFILKPALNKARGIERFGQLNSPFSFEGTSAKVHVGQGP